ncbi:MAG: hypothetical protein P8X86_03165 [Desulfofustis sp.]|jgi:hypothetical protein
MNNNDKPQMGKLKGWTVLLSVCCFVYLFAVKLAPWLLLRIRGLEKIAEVVEEQNIDAGAYYYTEIEGSYEGQQYLSQSIQLMAPDQYGLTLPFLLGIVLCLLILYVGMKSLPR